MHYRKMGVPVVEGNVVLGAQLRALRESCGLSGVTVARELDWTQSKLSRVETGRFGASLTEVADLLEFYGAPDGVRAELLAHVARNDNMPGAWVVRAGGARRRTANLANVESRVSRMRQYAGAVVPGLLQAPEYMAALLRVGGWDSPEQIATSRRERQQRLSAEGAHPYEVVIDARALARWPGDASVMTAQLDHLIHLPGSVHLRVLPEGAGATAVPLGSFLLYEFEEQPSVVLCEAQVADLYLSAPEDVASYAELFARLVAEALTPEDSATYLQHLSRSLRESREPRRNS